MNVFVYLSCIVIHFASTAQSVRPQCGLYGAPPCLFVPAAPGQTPACARPGSTYCEKMHHYPMKVVNQLITRFGYDINKLLIDETADDFHTAGTEVFSPMLGHGSSHGPNIPFSHNQPNTPNRQNPYIQPSYQPQPETNTNNDGYSYPKPNAIPSATGGYNYPAPNSLYQTNTVYNEEPIYIPKPRPQADYRINSPRHQNPAPQINFVIERQEITEYNPADTFRRYTRDTSMKNHTKDIDLKHKTNAPSNELPLEFDENESVSTNRTRSKRQSFGRTQLCEVNTQFIMPQAALNSRGNWMFVINQDNMSRQLVKTETCASSVCSNLCQLPNGYNSRCEQKFIQKRLIALDANGQNFYTDTFWFPSCCVCTLSNQ